MPANYQSAAEALAVSPSRSPSPPSWTRDNHTSTRRLSSARMRSLSSSTTNHTARTRMRQAWAALESFNAYSIRTYNRMTPMQRVLAGLGIVGIYGVIILAWIYSHKLFDWLADISDAWAALPGGHLIMFALVFACAFPPMIGYSTLTTISGFVYGFPWGWPVVALACTLGSLGAFVASRTVFSKYVDRMVGRDKRFVALGQVLRRDGIWYLTGIRFCPLPFSLSNGFLATIPSITPLAFTISTALSSPKLLVHVFIGSRLAILAKSGDKMSFGDRMVNYLFMAIGATVGITVGLIIYRRTMARAAELAREAAEEEGRAPSPATAAAVAPYLDSEDTLMMDPEDAAALMSDDDMSLWETQVDEDAEEDSDSDGSGKKNGSGNGSGRKSPR